MTRFLLMIISLLFAAIAWAGDVEVSGAWIRQLPAGAPAGGYFALRNPGPQATALVGASSPDYGMVMMHKTVEQGGVAKMIDVDKIELPPGGKVAFHPGGYHLMLMNPKHRIAVGSTVPVTLNFSDGQKVTAQFEVRGPTAR
ncbi:MAG TPA: copper chaperone PCu(A)C [Burkholderiales bacterium]|nr:copper chaperone PCu(A)C [Burkholderiales bacterium]